MCKVDLQALLSAETANQPNQAPKLYASHIIMRFLIKSKCREVCVGVSLAKSGVV